MKYIKASIFGKSIGIIEDSKNGIRFQYDPEFPGHDLPISPIVMPYNPSKVFGYHESMAFKGMPGIFQDSIPEGFGLRMMLEHYREKFGAVFNLTPLQKLAFIGNNGIGAIEYEPAENDSSSSERFVELNEISASIKKFIEGSPDSVLKELSATPSPNGARPKTNIFWDRSNNRMKTGREITVSGFEPWIVKFFEKENELTMIEYVYMSLAKDIGLDVPEITLMDIAGEPHFMTKRFDRADGNKLHQASLSGLTNKDYMEQNIISYEEYLRITRMVTMNHTNVKEAFKRMVFNVVGVNCDDHIKNFSFLMDDTGTWKISPAYDLIYSNGLATYGEHKMSINGKNKEIDLNDIAQCGYSGGLDETFMKESIANIVENFASIGNRLKEIGVSHIMRSEIEKSVAINQSRLSIGLSAETFPRKAKRKNFMSSAHADIYRGLSMKR